MSQADDIINRWRHVVVSADRSFISAIDIRSLSSLSSTVWPSINPNYRQIIGLRCGRANVDRPGTSCQHLAGERHYVTSRSMTLQQPRSQLAASTWRTTGSGGGLSMLKTSFMHETCAETRVVMLSFCDAFSYGYHYFTSLAVYVMHSCYFCQLQL